MGSSARKSGVDLGIPYLTDEGLPSPQPLSELRFAVVDVETTGLFPARDRIVEVAVEIVDHRGVRLDGFETLVNPERDMGVTHIHGIAAGMVKSAPRFQDIASDLLAWLGAGSVWVGHNVTFDIRFIKEEMGRVGLGLPPTPALCTLSLARRLYPHLGSHRLDCVCQHVGIPCLGRHEARTDAATTAALLGRLLQDAAQCGLDLWPAQSTASVVPLHGSSGKSERSAPDSPASRLLTRGQAQTQAQAVHRSYVERLWQNLRPCTGFASTNDKIGLYLHLLDRALEDRRIDEVEQKDLLAMAEVWGLGAEDAVHAHDIYLRMVVETALADGIVTANEQADLSLVCDLLGVRRGRLKELLDEGTSTSGIDRMARDRSSDRADLVGLSVCFTGVTPGPSGEPITRQEAERLATVAGLVVAANVTKKLDLLVVADPDTQSCKAKKARGYGTRVMAAEVFWKSISPR